MNNEDRNLPSESDDEWDHLIEAHLRGELTEPQKEQLAERLDSDPAARQNFVEQVMWDTQLADGFRLGSSATPDISTHRERSTGRRRFGAIVATFAAIAALVFVVIQSRDLSRQNSYVAKITGVSGPLQWTGNGGRVSHNLSVGTQLSGGTIDGLSPDSWFELQFNDGSTITISGSSMLVFSDNAQKTLHLKSGFLSANVVPQPQGRPMLVHTRSATLTVVGTTFEVEAGLSSTELNVSEGEVHLTRLSDGNTVQVPARHRVLAGEENELTTELVPETVDHWLSHIDRGPDNAWGNYGKWLKTGEGQPAALKAIPLVPRENPSVTLQLLGLSVVDESHSPIVIRPTSTFIVRGRLSRQANVRFGFRVFDKDGHFAGKYISHLPSDQFSEAGGEFEFAISVDQFQPDPSVSDRRHGFPASPEDLMVTNLWAFTFDGRPSGLAITSVALIPRPLE